MDKVLRHARNRRYTRHVLSRNSMDLINSLIDVFLVPKDNHCEDVRYQVYHSLNFLPYPIHSSRKTEHLIIMKYLWDQNCDCIHDWAKVKTNNRMDPKVYRSLCFAVQEYCEWLACELRHKQMVEATEVYDEIDALTNKYF